MITVHRLGKPRLRRYWSPQCGEFRWLCSGDGFHGNAITAALAYHGWVVLAARFNCRPEHTINARVQ